MSQKTACKQFFSVDKFDKNTWKCKCGEVFIQAWKTGWSISFEHIKSQHPKRNLCESMESRISFAPTITKKSLYIYGWLKLVYSSLKPFSFVEDELNCGYWKLEPFSVNSWKKYMGLVRKEVEKRIAAKLTEKLVLIFDRCKQLTHFVGVFAASSGLKTRKLPFLQNSNQPA